MFSSSELKRYAQQIRLEEIGVHGQKKLQKSRVLCVGAGGIGATLLPYLAGAGVGTLGIIDDDFIEESNLHRQILYQEKDIYHLKATTAKMKLQGLNSNINIQVYEARLNNENAEDIIAQYDLVADCSDNFYTRYLTHGICYRLEKPYVYASAYQFQGHCSLFYGKDNPCLHCLFPVIPDSFANCQNGGVLGTLPGLLGIVQATEIIKWITQSGVSLLNRLLCIDFLSMEMKNIHLVKNEECSFCVSGQTVEKNIFTQSVPSDEMQSFAVLADALPSFLQNNPDALLLDVRTVTEHNMNNLGGTLIPLSELPDRFNELNPLQTTLIYCQSGQRSQRALILLRQAGFRTVYHLANGLDSVISNRSL
ncbi:thiamine biosynthesis protein ThiF [Legionella qingyii]|uniref:Molybdopterin-synthase adenylyltransferase n=1 Tax=Legionella qingyii TaxID=2184757 RepID=A0A317UAP5_9GAMM|nr:HesA/MoeB/ThiF family protein [Legionella qingyii]PWY57500.1 thiamine biosynthesis protein ThiF [Legionella qingyii]RUR23316.1 thiamine biosynthesis protein ThiF [Legionella qingyii]RUR26583.1 thiamine biosynthesis protein ThiF [Legionella qingyii]